MRNRLKIGLLDLSSESSGSLVPMQSPPIDLHRFQDYLSLLMDLDQLHGVVLSSENAGANLVPLQTMIQDLRTQANCPPVIVVGSELDSETLRILLSSGASDVVDVRNAEFELQPRVLARAMSTSAGTTAERHLVGNLWIDSKCYRASLAGSDPSLTSLEYRLLQFLIERKDRVVTRRDILEKIWPNTHVSERTVDVHVSTLPKKLKPWNYEIVSLYGAGYGIRPKKSVTVNDPKPSEQGQSLYMT